MKSSTCLNLTFVLPLAFGLLACGSEEKKNTSVSESQVINEIEFPDKNDTNLINLDEMQSGQYALKRVRAYEGMTFEKALFDLQFNNPGVPSERDDKLVVAAKWDDLRDSNEVRILSTSYPISLNVAIQNQEAQFLNDRTFDMQATSQNEGLWSLHLPDNTNLTSFISALFSPLSIRDGRHYRIADSTGAVTRVDGGIRILTKR